MKLKGMKIHNEADVLQSYRCSSFGPFQMCLLGRELASRSFRVFQASKKFVKALKLLLAIILQQSQGLSRSLAVSSVSSNTGSCGQRTWPNTYGNLLADFVAASTQSYLWQKGQTISLEGNAVKLFFFGDIWRYDFGFSAIIEISELNSLSQNCSSI